MSACVVAGCGAATHARELCASHYSRARRGVPFDRPMQRHWPVTAHRFWSFVDSSRGSESCWLWLGPLNEQGYGKARLPKPVVSGPRGAHRVAWYWTFGCLPADGIQLDHLCRVRRCVNPAHLEEVTPRENTMRSDASSVAYSLRDRCDAGHELSGGNLAVRRDGSRKCRRCHRDYMRQYRRRAA